MEDTQVSSATPQALLAAATAALDALSQLPVDAFTNAELGVTLTGLVALEQKCAAQAARVGRCWDRSMVWALDGSKSAAAALSRESGLSPRSCRTVLKRGADLADMPVTAAALADAAITVDQVVLLANARTREREALFERDEAELVEHAEVFRYGEFVKIVAYWKQVVDAELGNDGTAPVFDQRALSLCPGLDGETLIDGVLDEIGGGIVRAGIDAVVNELKLADRDLPEDQRRTRRQLQADALVELVVRGLAAPHDAVKPRILLTVACGDETFARLCELSDGSVVTPAALVPYGGLIDVNAILFDGPTYAIEGSSQRCYTGLLRRAIELRDRHCQEPCGCDEPIDRCDVDHAVPNHVGGITDQETGRLRCRYHNRIWANRPGGSINRARLAGLKGEAYLLAWRQQAQTAELGQPPP